MHEFEMTTPRASLEDNVWSIQIMLEETIRKQIMSAGGGGGGILSAGRYPLWHWRQKISHVNKLAMYVLI
jgi:hypothetical protein